MIRIAFGDRRIEILDLRDFQSEPLFFSADDKGVKELYDYLEKKEYLDKIVFSSTIDYPEDAGLPVDFDLPGMMRDINDKRDEEIIREVFSEIDKMVEEGRVEELANKCKKQFILNCERDPNDYGL